MICIFLLNFLIFFRILLLAESSIIGARHKKLISPAIPFFTSGPRTTHLYKRDDIKRGLQIGLKMKIPTTENSKDLTILQEELQELEKKLRMDKADDSTHRIGQLLPPSMLLKPSFECDRWDSKTRTCWVDRNTGGTVTFSLTTSVRRRSSQIVWRREFAQGESPIMMEYILNPEKPSRNLVIGKNGHELRISPITEIDVDDNLFSASFAGNSSAETAKVNFRIRIMAEDLGFVYVGETIDLSIESYIALPFESVTYDWYTEKEGEIATLPSNMRVSANGQTLRISELRQEQEGIIACSIYTNRNVHATKKRFLIKDLSKTEDVLKTFSHKEPSLQIEIHNRQKKAFKHRSKLVNDNKTDLTRDKSVAKRKSKIKRKFSKAKLKDGKANFDGHRHTRTRPNQDVKLLLMKRFPNAAESTKTKLATKRKSKRQKEISHAELEGDSYTIFRPTADASNNSSRKLQLIKRDPEDEDIYPTAESDEGIGTDFSNTADRGTLNIDFNKEMRLEDDNIARIISDCVRDFQCSKHASCVRKNIKSEGFCRCLPGYYGPGIFCREEI